jgi:CDP-diacylglycerol--serine O-phosphatidyltransferase
MIGFYDYSVWLTYFSLLSASLGILVTLHGDGHPYWGIFFLMFSGLCDAFDGRVARTKKNRTDAMKAFGIQIDSLSDLVAFGVLPACIGEAMASVGPGINGVTKITFDGHLKSLLPVLLLVIMLFYVLAALIRLAYFNVLEEERQKTETGCRKTYIGLPVTSAALIFPSILLIQYITPFDVTCIYFIFLLLTGFLFLFKFNVPKPGLRGILIMVAFGLLEGALLLVGIFFRGHYHI